jgi:hypothetical protein
LSDSALGHIGYAGLAHGNRRSAWDGGCRFDFPDPEYR